MCLKQLEDENGNEVGLNIGIQPDLQLSRSANIGGWNNPTAIYLVIFVLLSGCSIIAMRKKYGRAEGRLTFNYLTKKIKHKNSKDYTKRKRKKFQSMPNLAALAPDPDNV